MNRSLTFSVLTDRSPVDLKIGSLCFDHQTNMTMSLLWMLDLEKPLQYG